MGAVRATGLRGLSGPSRPAGRRRCRETRGRLTATDGRGPRGWRIGWLNDRRADGELRGHRVHHRLDRSTRAVGHPTADENPRHHGRQRRQKARHESVAPKHA